MRKKGRPLGPPFGSETGGVQLIYSRVVVSGDGRQCDARAVQHYARDRKCGDGKKTDTKATNTRLLVE